MIKKILAIGLISISFLCFARIGNVAFKSPIKIIYDVQQNDYTERSFNKLWPALPIPECAEKYMKWGETEVTYNYSWVDVTESGALVAREVVTVSGDITTTDNVMVPVVITTKTPVSETRTKTVKYLIEMTAQEKSVKDSTLLATAKTSKKSELKYAGKQDFWANALLNDEGIEDYRNTLKSKYIGLRDQINLCGTVGCLNDINW